MEFLVPPVKYFTKNRPGKNIRFHRKVNVQIKGQHVTPVRDYLEQLLDESGIQVVNGRQAGTTISIEITRSILKHRKQYPRDPALRKQAYALTCKPGSVAIDAESPEGAFYALTTLRQIILSQREGPD